MNAALPSANAQSGNRITKAAVARSFSRAAGSYDRVAELQRHAGERLLAQVPPDFEATTLVDGGAGTGFFAPLLNARLAPNRLILLDIAPGMLAFARDRRPTASARHLCADLEALPLATGTVDLLFTSLAIQWLADLPGFFREAARVLRPGGRLLFATLGPATLQEMRAAWQQVDSAVHVNRFTSAEAVHASAGPADWSEFHLEEELRVRHYAQLRDLTHELKALGAHNLSQEQPKGLAGRGRLQRFRTAYEALRTPSGLPASWQLLYGSAVR